MASTTDIAAEPAPLHKHPYHLVDPSPWPIVGAFAGGALVLGIILLAHYGIHWMLYLGIAGVLATMFFWWRDVLIESRTPGLHTPVVRIGLRYGMTLFIASEVMFFVAFFWAYFHFALYPEHVSGAATAIWPPKGVLTFDPFGLPFLNTMILLLSGCTVTWAHHSLIHGDRKGLIAGLAITVLLGISFSTFQAIEYAEAPFALHRRRLSLGLLPGDRLPRLPRHRRHHLPAGLPDPRHQGRLHPAAAFRLRGGGLVLALRRRGVAVPLRLHLLPGCRRDRGALMADATGPAPLAPVVLLGRCPRCGSGPLFSGLLAVRESLPGLRPRPPGA